VVFRQQREPVAGLRLALFERVGGQGFFIRSWIGMLIFEIWFGSLVRHFSRADSVSRFGDVARKGPEYLQLCKVLLAEMPKSPHLSFQELMEVRT
jgi:hypothetical protein